jgi:hypothetical protein
MSDVVKIVIGSIIVIAGFVAVILPESVFEYKKGGKFNRTRHKK